MAMSEFSSNFGGRFWCDRAVVCTSFSNRGSVPKMQKNMDRILLKIPVFGGCCFKSAVARWTRTLSTMFAAGVPLVDALDSVGGAAGNAILPKPLSKFSGRHNWHQLDQRHAVNSQHLPSHGHANDLHWRRVWRPDQMLGKAADFYEEEVDEAVKALSSLMEPFIIVILGGLIGGIVVAMYLPIFKIGQVV